LAEENKMDYSKLKKYLVYEIGLSEFTAERIIDFIKSLE